MDLPRSIQMKAGRQRAWHQHRPILHVPVRDRYHIVPAVQFCVICQWHLVTETSGCDERGFSRTANFRILIEFYGVGIFDDFQHRNGIKAVLRVGCLLLRCTAGLLVAPAVIAWGLCPLQDTHMVSTKSSLWLSRHTVVSVCSKVTKGL